uniref:Relaxin 1 n=1 Tax=Acanthochromis polyacanthus TaxID=80966 RepID=A0A3Q1ECU8_9TELE
MMWRLTLALAVVCNCVKADVMSRLILPRDYGVKLCGREFIRAVIFTCGGSRWKRSTEGDLEIHSPVHIASSFSLMDLLRSPGVPDPTGDSKKRNFSLGVAGMCCTQGCTKNDIGRLC